MTAPTEYHQIGKFIVYFQHVEAAINEILVLLANADDEAVRILVNELEFETPQDNGCHACKVR